MKVFVIAKWDEEKKKSELDNIESIYREVVRNVGKGSAHAISTYLRIFADIHGLGSNWCAGWGHFFSEKLKNLFVVISPKPERDEEIEALKKGDFELREAIMDVVYPYEYYLQGYRDGVKETYSEISRMTLGEILRAIEYKAWEKCEKEVI